MRKLFSLLGLRFKFYKHPNKNGGWIAWFETKKGKVLGFVRKNGEVVFDW